ncbi:MAG TPA: DoxX family protein [Beijerinckiaceae bacterium]|jgi:putative oxidoreductase
MPNLLYALGRIALVAIFLWSGFGKLMAPDAVAGAIAAKGLPYPKILAYLAGVAELGLAALVVIGWQAKVAALGLIAFTLIATFFFHDFWTMSGELRRMNQIQALKNLGLIGGLLMLAAAGPGRYGLGKK